MPYLLFLFVLIFSPLAFGTVEQWSLGIVEVVVPLTLLLFCGSLRSNRDHLLQVPGLLPLILLLCWLLLQLVPLPPGLVRTVSPATYAVYTPLLQLSDTHWIPLTVHPRSTLQELLRIGTYGLFFILTVQLLVRHDRLQKTVTLVVWLAIAIAIEAITQKLSSDGLIYWFRPAPPKTTPFGPWLYKNHFAGFMVMVFPLVLALFLYFWPKVTLEESLRARFLSYLSISGFNNHLLLGSGAVLIAVAILLSVSRGGIVAFCTALFFLAFFSSNRISGLRKRWIIVFLIPVMLLATWLGGQSITGKFSRIWGEQGLDTKGRLPVLLDSLNVVKDFPLTGTGFGTFEFVYPGYRSAHGLSHLLYDHAHNDYLELFVTGGSVGFLLVAWFLAAVLLHCFRGLRKHRERFSVLLTIGALTGIFAVLMYCFVDFQMYNGANGLYFFFFCGLAVSAVDTRLYFRSQPSLLPSGSRLANRLVPVVALAVFAGSLWFNGAVFRAARLYAPVRSVFINRNIPDHRLQELYNQAQRSARLDYLQPGYYLAMADISVVMGQREQAGAEYLKACMLSPLSGEYIQRLALHLGTDQAETADMLLALGCDYEPLILDRYLIHGDWLISAGNRNEAMAVLKKGLARQPIWVSQLSGFVMINRLTRKEISDMLPAHSRAWYEMGRLMERAGDKDEAEFYHQQAMKFKSMDNSMADEEENRSR